MPKEAIILIFLILLQTTFIGSSQSSSSFKQHGTIDICKKTDKNRTGFPRLRSDQLTVLINGFSESRFPLLQRIASIYSSSPVVHSVYILWGNASTPIETLKSFTFQSLGAPIFLLQEPNASLNNRFLPRTFIRTKAVVIADDDVEIEVDSVRFAFNVWQTQPEKIVGFFARSHEFDLNLRSWIYTISPGKYSILLTKFMILATDYLWEYSCGRMPEKIRQVVNEKRNCEDIAMNFLVSRLIGLGPVLVEGRARDFGDSRNSEGGSIADVGLSSIGNHRKRRGECIREFHLIWGMMSLRYSYGKVVDGVKEQGLCEKAGKLVPCDQELEY